MRLVKAKLAYSLAIRKPGIQEEAQDHGSDIRSNAPLRDMMRNPWEYDSSDSRHSDDTVTQCVVG